MSHYVNPKISSTIIGALVAILVALLSKTSAYAQISGSGLGIFLFGSLGALIGITISTLNEDKEDPPHVKT